MGPLESAEVIELTKESLLKQVSHLEHLAMVNQDLRRKYSSEPTK